MHASGLESDSKNGSKNEWQLSLTTSRRPRRSMLPLASSILFGLPLETIDTSEVISQPSRAQVLVIVSDSGSGTTDFGDALNKHPCMFNLGEPFMQSAMMWSKSEIAGCVYPDALFDADSGLLKHNNNTQLTRKIGQLRSSKARQAWQETGKRPDENLAGDSPLLYESLDYNLADYFVRIRDHVCASVPAEICPPSDCTVTLKMFPQFVNAHTGPTPPTPGRCTDARNEKAMTAWRQALESMKSNPKVVTFALLRNELDRQFSVFRRFSLPGTQFDCSVPRAPSAFANVSTSYTDTQMQIESCWKDATGADKCVRDALGLVGLSSMPVIHAGKAINIMQAGEVSFLYHAAQASCATDPDATFKRVGQDKCVGQVDALDKCVIIEGRSQPPYSQPLANVAFEHAPKGVSDLISDLNLDVSSDAVVKSDGALVFANSNVANLRPQDVYQDVPTPGESYPPRSWPESFPASHPASHPSRTLQPPEDQITQNHAVGAADCRCLAPSECDKLLDLVLPGTPMVQQAQCGCSPNCMLVHWQPVHKITEPVDMGHDALPPLTPSPAPEPDGVAHALSLMPSML